MFTSTPSSIEDKCDQVTRELLETSTEACKDLNKIPSVIKCYSGTLIPLVKPKSYSVRVCGQEDTVYAGNEDELEAWKDFYLPERQEMEVIGAIDDFPCEAFGLQLVLLLCEDGNVYAYEDEVLHLVARSLKELFENGLVFPGLETFKLGECFEDYTEEKYNTLMESSEIKEIEEDFRKFHKSLDDELLQSLKRFKDQYEAELAIAADVKDRRQENTIQPVNTEDCSYIVDRPKPTVPWNDSCSNDNSTQNLDHRGINRAMVKSY